VFGLQRQGAQRRRRIGVRETDLTALRGTAFDSGASDHTVHDPAMLANEVERRFIQPPAKQWLTAAWVRGGAREVGGNPQGFQTAKLMNVPRLSCAQLHLQLA
jgi:hypothetical protein